MTDRPIIFSAPMVKALLDGRKTMTRRLAYRNVTACSLWHRVQPGDRLYVREAWAEVGSGDPGLIVTRADYPACVPRQYENVPPADQIRWRPSIHMPRRASRLTLTVMATKIERLHGISAEDAQAEGLWRGRARRHLWWHGPTECRLLEPYQSHTAAFAALWDSLHGADSWAANPAVVALTFSVERRNIDAKVAA